MERRSPLTDLAGLGLLAWAILLAYVCVPPLFNGDMVSRGVNGIGGFPALPLAVPAGMVIVYGLIVVILLRAGGEFSRG